MKRAFDILLSTTLVVPIVAICAVLAPIIAIDCRASPLFVQTRVGRNGKTFRLIKLRTMSPKTAHMASHLAPSDAITRTGHWLRKLKLDELPQILNVLSGAMSLVGPRPCLPTQVELIEARRANRVLSLRPGVTGVAQIAGIDMRDPERLAAADAAYLGRWSIARDVAILIATATGSGRGDAIGQQAP